MLHFMKYQNHRHNNKCITASSSHIPSFMYFSSSSILLDSVPGKCYTHAYDDKNAAKSNKIERNGNIKVKYLKKM